MNTDIIQWMILIVNAGGLIGVVIYNSGKSGMSDLKDSLLRMEDRAERNTGEISNAMQNMVDKLYDLGGRVSELEGITKK